MTACNLYLRLNLVIDELLSQQDAEAILAPHMSALRRFLEQGWSDWHESVLAAPKLATTRATSRANVVYDRITLHAEAYFEAVGIPCVRKGQMLVVSFDDGRLILRFKKFRSRKLGTSGIPTEQRLEFELQQVVLDGTAATYVVAGYLPDELGIGLDVLAIACTYNGRVIWRIDLSDDSTTSVVRVRVDSPQGPSVRSTRPAALEEVEG
ncbi:hypothetical protein SAMN04487846_3570 [Microbacterium sp. cf046]|nr:hypothetical protein SAMN04487846_3570 [Microbacterium sp. cf046]